MRTGDSYMQPTAIVEEGRGIDYGNEKVLRTFNVMWPFYTAPRRRQPDTSATPEEQEQHRIDVARSCVTTVQLNTPMAELLREFIFDFADDGELEVELYALAEALSDRESDRKWSRSAAGTAFVVSRLEGAVIISMTRPIRDMLLDLIQSAEPRSSSDPYLEKEIHVLGKALHDPNMCYEVRQQKRNERSQAPRDNRKQYNGKQHRPSNGDRNHNRHQRYEFRPDER